MPTRAAKQGPPLRLGLCVGEATVTLLEVMLEPMGCLSVEFPVEIQPQVRADLLAGHGRSPLCEAHRDPFALSAFTVATGRRLMPSGGERIFRSYGNFFFWGAWGSLLATDAPVLNSEVAYG